MAFAGKFGCCILFSIYFLGLLFHGCLRSMDSVAQIGVRVAHRMPMGRRGTSAKVSRLLGLRLDLFWFLFKKDFLSLDF